jgi:hypothetical protein
VFVDGTTAGAARRPPICCEPRGPGSLTIDRELTGPCPLQRHVRRRAWKTKSIPRTNLVDPPPRPDPALISSTRAAISTGATSRCFTDIADRATPTDFPVPTPLVHSLPVERFAVQRRGRRTSGSLMLLQFPCGDCVRCNGLLGSVRDVVLATC